MRVLVLGGYGFIGLALVERLRRDGHDVVGFGRSEETGRRLQPDMVWRSADLATLDEAGAWRDFLQDIDAVVNASGALQDGARDNLSAVHARAITALIEACEQLRVMRFVQISAPGAGAQSSIPFLRTKALADERLRRSELAWTILRPGLVIGPGAYGGTALLRMLAGFPLVQPLVFGNARLQTVALADVVDVVVQAVAGNLPEKSDVDLVEPEAHTLADLVTRLRRWLGVPPARAQLDLPPWSARALARIADVLGYLGWRSPLRSTAMQIVAEGVRGDPAPLHAILGRELSGLDDTLAALPRTVQERWFARLYLAMPLMIATLSSFWLLSGVIALLDVDAAVAVLPAALERAGGALVVGGALVDIALGAGVLYRPWARRACAGMLGVTLLYLAAGTLFTPHLWADPLGPFVKTVPAAVLAAITPIVLMDR